MRELLNNIVIEELADYIFEYGEYYYTEDALKADKVIDEVLDKYVSDKESIDHIQDCISSAEGEYDRQGFKRGFKEALRLIGQRNSNLLGGIINE